MEYLLWRSKLIWPTPDLWGGNFECMAHASSTPPSWLHLSFYKTSLSAAQNLQRTSFSYDEIRRLFLATSQCTLRLSGFTDQRKKLSEFKYVKKFTLSIHCEYIIFSPINNQANYLYLTGPPFLSIPFSLSF
ncbi:hypothetical protein J6590_056114 [Homalodisca vitripennis]|nr:hypothetical protein J6590_056114 [Homalodisca vitripennis]